MRSATPATPLFLVGLLAISLSSLAFAADRSPDQRFEVVGYLPEYRLGGFNYEAAFESGLTYLLFFSLEISARGEPSALDRLPSKEDARDARRAADKVGGKILISFGGNARSQNFGEMATSVTKRQVFLGKLEKLMLEYGFDGVDYNWEYPRKIQGQTQPRIAPRDRFCPDNPRRVLNSEERGFGRNRLIRLALLSAYRLGTQR